MATGTIFDVPNAFFCMFGSDLVNPGDKTSVVEIARGQAVENEPDKRSPIITDELRRLGAALGPEFVWAVLTNKERELTLEKGLDRSEPGRGSGGRELDRERDMERGR